jgi:hypothetical protein
MASNILKKEGCYTFIDYQMHIKTEKFVVSVMLTLVLNVLWTCRHQVRKTGTSFIRIALRFPGAVDGTHAFAWFVFSISLRKTCTMYREYATPNMYNMLNYKQAMFFLSYYQHNCSTSDVGVFHYTNVV